MFVRACVRVWGIQGFGGGGKQGVGVIVCLEAASSQSESHHEAIQHRCYRDRVHEWRMHLRVRKDDQSSIDYAGARDGGKSVKATRRREECGGRSRRGKEGTRTTTPAPALRTKCSSPWTSPML